MKFTIEKDVLLESLNTVIRAISTRNIIPVLSGIKFELTQKDLTLTASDSELSIKVSISEKNIKKIEKVGAIIIQSKYIVEIIKKLPDPIINFEIIDGLKIKISSANSLYNLNCLDPNDYPEIKVEESKTPIILNSKDLNEVINNTVFAISQQESRPLLTGLNICIKEEQMECVATDSYRLAKKNIKLNHTIKENINIVIPGKNLIELSHIIDSDEEVEMHIFNSKVLFKFKNVLFQTNLLSGTYPDTSSLIPKDFNIIVNANIKYLYDAIDRASLLTATKDKNVVTMNTEGTKLLITSISSEIGKVIEELKIEKESSEDIKISYNARYFLEALKTFNDENVLIMMNKDSTPIIIKSIKDESLIQLVLPIKTF